MTPGNSKSAPTAEFNKSPITEEGPDKFEVMATWTDYKKAGPLLLSLDHRGTRNGDPLRVSFSNVAVKLAGSSTWMDAQ